ncbi:Ttg2B ABC-type transport system involved in resistance to organic solvents, permease component [Methylophilaceae bacterium]|jgi:phospholipid/cholesterol/gamma-HCH transport system permease protein
MMQSNLLTIIANKLRGVGHRMIERTWRLGVGARLFGLAIVYSGESFKRFNLTLREIYFTGVMSLLIIVVSAFFVGMVLALQGYNTLQKYGSSEAIGVLVALALVRELGPVVTALLFAGRAGTAITAEIGLMKATEQLSAMEMMAVNPIARVIAPRFWAGVISMPILATIFSMVGILGGYLVAVPLIGVDDGAFWSQMQANVDFRLDIVNGLIKSLVFGVACTMIALFEGFDAPPTAEGVSRATTRTVVISSLTVLALDFVLTSFMMVV